MPQSTSSRRLTLPLKHRSDGVPTMSEQYEKELKEASKYSVGTHRVALFGGADLWPILKPNGKQICQTIGAREEADELVRLLNEGR